MSKSDSDGVAELGFAVLDLDRARRLNFPEVIYCPGKTDAQIAAIAARLYGEDKCAVLASRAEQSAFDAVRAVVPDAQYHERARLIVLPGQPAFTPPRVLAVVTAGTADEPVAEEAAVTAEVLGFSVERIYDAGVAGLHRILRARARLEAAEIVIVVAGMDGALPSVVGGLVGVPVIAVPTSVGYGAAFGGVAALLTMLNSCAPGVTVVNIDNGFGAAYAAGRMALRAKC